MIKHSFAGTLRPSKSSLKKLTLAFLACGLISFVYAAPDNDSSLFIASTEGIKGSGGIVTREDGKLLTASSPKVIRIFNPFTGHFEGVAYQLTEVSGLPDDLAIIPRDNSRNIIGGFSVASFLDGRIPTILNDATPPIQSNQGQYILSPETGVYQATYNPELLGADPIAYRKSNDRLYSTGFDPYNIYKLDWRGSVPVAVPLLPFVPEGRALNAFQFGPDDKLYAPDIGHQQIVQIDADTGLVTPVVLNAGDTPIAVKVDSHGIIYFIGRKTGKVYSFNPANPPNTPPTELATLEPALDNLTLNREETKLYITNDENKIFEVNISTHAKRTLFQSPVGQIWDIAYDKDSNSVYVADFASIKKFNANNSHLESIFRFGDINSGISQLGSQASSITVEEGQNAKIIVSDVTLGNIIVLNKNNYSVHDITLTSDKTGLFFKQPLSAVRVTGGTPSEYYLATNTVDGTIIKIYHNGPIDPNNIVVENFFTGLRSPIKLKLYKGYVYVVELGQVAQGVPNTGRISRISLANPQNRQILVDGLNDPQGLDIFDGKIYFVESGNQQLMRASAAHPSQKEFVKGNLNLQQDIIVSQFNPVAKVNPPSGVAIGKKGKRLYVNETGPDAIREFKKND